VWCPPPPHTHTARGGGGGASSIRTVINARAVSGAPHPTLIAASTCRIRAGRQLNALVRRLLCRTSKGDVKPATQCIHRAAVNDWQLSVCDQVGLQQNSAWGQLSYPLLITLGYGGTLLWCIQVVNE
jgi:hypothetical protein